MSCLVNHVTIPFWEYKQISPLPLVYVQIVENLHLTPNKRMQTDQMPATRAFGR